LGEQGEVVGKMANKTVTEMVQTLDGGKVHYQVVMLADKDGNLLNSFGASANIPIAAGIVDGYSHINKFGYRDSFPSTFQTIWDGTIDYIYSLSGAISAVADTPATDDGGTVEVQGLDQNYNAVTETLTIGGAASTAQFVRVFRARMVTANTGLTNVDEIRIQSVGGSTDEAIIKAGAGQTLMAVYTVPAGKTGYLLKINGSIDANNNALFRLYTRPFGGAFNVRGQFGVFASGFNYDYPVPLRFEEKTDIEVKALSQNNVGGGAIFDIILKDN